MIKWQSKVIAKKLSQNIKSKLKKNYDCSTSFLLPVSFNYLRSVQVFNLSLKNVINNFLCKKNFLKNSFQLDVYILSVHNRLSLILSCPLYRSKFMFHSLQAWCSFTLLKIYFFGNSFLTGLAKKKRRTETSQHFR